MYHVTIIPKTLVFKQPAGTSRGVYTDHQVWYLRMTDTDRPGKVGWGECAPLVKLSCDDLPDYESVLKRFCDRFDGAIDYEAMRDYPSMLFGLETALRDLNSEAGVMWKSPFTEGKSSILINGLIWMGTYEEMSARIEEKLKAGFSCIKLKIGSLRFNDELDLLKKIRGRFSKDIITLRVDANGGFKPAEAMERLERLAALDIHSIEQPIMAGQWEDMARLCARTPLPIALDEELIGVNDTEEKNRLLDVIRPQYIILKPSLHGGIWGSEEWISLAKRRNIGYWITSALESNVGLNAIAQWAATLGITIPQGLGTGALYVNNVERPIEVVGEHLWYRG